MIRTTIHPNLLTTGIHLKFGGPFSISMSRSTWLRTLTLDSATSNCLN